MNDNFNLVNNNDEQPENGETFQEWQSRIRSQLESVDSLDSSEGLDGDKIATLDVRITWKSFEEEAKELMNQLERLRLQEVDIEDFILYM